MISNIKYFTNFILDIQNNYFGYLKNRINVNSACHIRACLHKSNVAGRQHSKSILKSLMDVSTLSVQRIYDVKAVNGVHTFVQRVCFPLAKYLSLSLGLEAPRDHRLGEFRGLLKNLQFKKKCVPYSCRQLTDSRRDFCSSPKRLRRTAIV